MFNVFCKAVHLVVKPQRTLLYGNNQTKSTFCCQLPGTACHLTFFWHSCRSAQHMEPRFFTHAGTDWYHYQHRLLGLSAGHYHRRYCRGYHRHETLVAGRFIFHLVGIILTITANGFWALFISTLLIGMGNGTVEAACNPLVASLYTTRKTAKLNHFHLWFPGGIVIGTLIVRFFGVEVPGTTFLSNWKVLVAIMMIPTFLYGFLFFRLKFPVTERVASGVTSKQMYQCPAVTAFYRDDHPDVRHGYYGIIYRAMD